MSEAPEHAKEIDELLQALWVKNLPILAERLKLIRTAREKLDSGLVDDQSRKEGEEAAHKLAGILGTFGLPQGSVLASKIEVLLAGEGSTCAKRASELSAWVQELEAVIASRP
jgi:HPt (histidine-containing phosphotransfer) domain-containing protein